MMITREVVEGDLLQVPVDAFLPHTDLRPGEVVVVTRADLYRGANCTREYPYRGFHIIITTEAGEQRSVCSSFFELVEAEIVEGGW